jgi:hypothetical protein
MMNVLQAHAAPTEMVRDMLLALGGEVPPSNGGASVLPG